MPTLTTINLCTRMDFYDACKRYDVHTAFYQPYKNDVFSALEFTASGIHSTNLSFHLTAVNQHDDLQALLDALEVEGVIRPKGDYHNYQSSPLLYTHGSQAFVDYSRKKDLLTILKNLEVDIKTLKKFSAISTTQRLLSIDNGRPDWLQLANINDEDTNGDDESNENDQFHPLVSKLANGSVVQTHDVESFGQACHTERSWIRVDCHNPLITKLTHVIVSFEKSRTGKSIMYRLYIPNYKELYSEYNEIYVQELKDLAKNDAYDLALIPGCVKISTYAD